MKRTIKNLVRNFFYAILILLFLFAGNNPILPVKADNDSNSSDVTVESTAPANPRGDTLYFNGQQWGSVNCWNPYSNNCNNAMAIAEQDNARVTMFETPYIYNMMDGKVYPLLADGAFSWDAGMTKITFKIKSAAHWSDGTAVTANDVAYTWTTHEKYNDSIYNSFNSFVANVKAVDSTTVEVDAQSVEGGDAAKNPLMVQSYLSTAYVIQKTWTQTLEARTGSDGAAFLNDPAEDVVYSGPYHKYYADDSIVILVRDDNYWGKDSSMWGSLPKPMYIAHKIYADNDSANSDFEAGNVDVSQQFIPNEQDLWTSGGLPVSTYLSSAPYQVGASLPTAYFNLGNETLKNYSVLRKAIAIAVNYDAIIANAMTNQSATFTQVPRSLMNPTPGEQALYDTDDSEIQALQWAGNDIAGANALLDAAGLFDSDVDGYRDIAGQDIQLTVVAPNGWEDWDAAATQIAAIGDSIGLNITTNFPDWSDYQAVVTNWSTLSTSTGYDIFLMWTDGAGPTEPWGRIYHLMSSDFAQIDGNWTGNWGGYSNSAADTLINAIPTLTDADTIKADYTQLVKIYLTDIPSFTVMYRPQSFQTVNESVWTNFPHEGDGTHPVVPPLDLTDGYSIAGLYNLVSLYPDTFSKSSPANGATKQATSLTLSWGDSNNFDSYEYCYSTSATCTNWQDNGTAKSVQLSGLKAGTRYYWNVRATNDHGSTYADHSLTPWSFTVGAAPAAFNKTSPTNAATNQALSVTLKWAASSGTTSYSVCYDTSNDKACSNWISTGTATSKAISGLKTNTTYYWQVKAVNSYGTTYANDASTAFWSFKTGGVPTAFNKSTPAKGATKQPASVTLKWAASSGATSYSVCYDTTNDNKCSNWVSAGTATSKTISGLKANTTYYWQVKANNSFGSTYANGASTAFWYFKTGTLPGAFNKSAPANGATNQPASITLKWAASSGATSYQYCYDTTNDNACSKWLSAGSATSKTITGLKASTKYYWQVRAVNANGYTYANSSTWWSFTRGK